jgi:hypothetical protein
MSQPLSLSKTTLNFELPPGHRRGQETLEIRNIENNYRYYKIMTTSKGRYIVKPSSGRLEPLGVVKVEIILSLNDNDVDLSKIRDKFAVYTLPGNEEFVDKKELDDYIQKNKKNVQQIIFTAGVSSPDSKESSTLYKSSILPIGSQRLSDIDENLEFQSSRTIQTKVSTDSFIPVSSMRESFAPADSGLKKNLSTPMMVSQVETDFPKTKMTESLPLATESTFNQSQVKKENYEVEKERSNELISKLQQQNTLLENELRNIRVA